MGSFSIVEMVFGGCGLRDGGKESSIPSKLRPLSVHLICNHGSHHVPTTRMVDVRISEGLFVEASKLFTGCKGPKTHRRERGHRVL